MSIRRLLLPLFISYAVAAGAWSAPVYSVEARWQGAPARPGATGTVVVRVHIQPGWHINSNAPLDPYLIATQVKLDVPAGWSAQAPRFPAHELVSLSFSQDPVAVFKGTIEAVVDVQCGASIPESLHGTVEAQACNDKVCLAPTELPFTVALAVAATVGGEPATTTAAAPGSHQQPSNQDGKLGVAGRLAGAGVLLQLALVFLAGLALNLTPCVYPLVPITMGFFAAQRETSKAQTWLLALTYVIGMSVTYSALGVVAALSGRLFGAALQSPLVIGGIVLVLLALAASMFGLWELRVPSWAGRISSGRSGFGGALLMGLVVGLVAAPCIGPFVLGLLTYVGQRQDPLLGFLLFFTLALGLGAPYLLLAVFTRAVERLPNSGAWMLGVRQLFGVALVALAAYFARPLFPAQTGQWLFAASCVLGGLYLLLIARPAHDQPWVDRLMRLASTIFVVAGVLLAPGRQLARDAHLDWAPYDEAAVARAIAGGKPVILDFFATWCLPCKELDEKTFADPEVAARLSSFARFKVDLTVSDERTEALRRAWSVAGVPTIVVLDNGKEIVGARLTGFEPPGGFLRRIAAANIPR